MDSYPVRLAVPVHGSTVSLSAGAADVQVTQAAGSTLRLTGKASYSLVRSSVTLRLDPVRGGRVAAVPLLHRQLLVQLPGRPARGQAHRPFRRFRQLDAARPDRAGHRRVRVRRRAGERADPYRQPAERFREHHPAARCPGPRSRSRTVPATLSSTAWRALDVVVTDGSGDIDLTFTKVPTRVRVSDSSGNVSVVLPRARALPGQRHHELRQPHRGRAPDNSAPDHVITVTDGSGNVSVTN